MLLSFRVCRTCSREDGLEMHLHWISNCRSLFIVFACTNQTKASFFPSILGSLRIIRKGARLQFSCRSAWTWFCVCREREKGERPTQRGQSSRRRAPQPKGQLSTAGGGENNGASARAVWKKDESGSLSISTACCHCSEPQGLRGRGGGRRKEMGQRRCRPSQKNNLKHLQYSFK